MPQAPIPSTENDHAGRCHFHDRCGRCWIAEEIRPAPGAEHGRHSAGIRATAAKPEGASPTVAAGPLSGGRLPAEAQFRPMRVRVPGRAVPAALCHPRLATRANGAGAAAGDRLTALGFPPSSRWRRTPPSCACPSRSPKPCRAGARASRIVRRGKPTAGASGRLGDRMEKPVKLPCRCGPGCGRHSWRHRARGRRGRTGRRHRPARRGRRRWRHLR